MDALNFPLVSVIIAFLNEERFITDAVESVLRQEYQYWELILIDDGSTDRSTAIAKQYAAEQSGKIIYCEHPDHLNKGLSASRNLGIRASSGTLLAILDADDVWLPGKLAGQVAIFQSHPDIGLVAESSLYWNSWNDPAANDLLIPVGAPSEVVYLPTELSKAIYPLGSTAAPCPSGLMFTKAAFLNVGGFEESFIKQYQLYEDQAFLGKIYLRERVYVSSACNNKYRQRQGSIVQATTEQGHYHAVRKYFLEWLQSYIRANKLESSQLDYLLGMALKPYRYALIRRAFSYLPIYKLRNLAIRGINGLKRRVKLAMRSLVSWLAGVNS